MKIISRRRKNARSTRKRTDEYDLPIEVLEFILSKLNLRNNICASAVSTRWLAAAVSVRRANNPPWLMLSPKYGDSYEFYDPLNCKIYHLYIPGLRNFRIRYVRNNWLLLEKPDDFGNFFLFCPYTRKAALVPKLGLLCECVAFSSAPTAQDCLIFAVSIVNPFTIAFRTCKPFANGWLSSYHQIPIPYSFKSWIFSDGCFYCLNPSGQLGVYNVGNDTWDFFPTPPRKLLKEDPYFGKRWRAKSIAVHDGTIYIVCVCASKNPVIYKFNMVSEMWVKVDSLCGVTIFVNEITSHAMIDLAGKMAGTLVFPKVLLYGKRCVFYAPGKHRYYPTDRSYNWLEEESFNRFWIEAPENTTSIFR